MVVRNSVWGMMKDGKYRAFRNLPVGWVLQVIHSTDKTERLIRLTTEIVFFMMLYWSLIMFGLVSFSYVSFICVFVVVHTIMWFLIGNFWVYMLDSFEWVHNPGIDKTISYLEYSEKILTKSDCCEAVLVYGSMSRGMFHDRSDLDLRVIRRTDSGKGFMAIIYGFWLRIYSFFIVMPVDLQVVDSMIFLQNQMREDEKPIVIYQRQGFEIYNSGLSFNKIKSNVSLVLKSENT